MLFGFVNIFFLVFFLYQMYRNKIPVFTLVNVYDFTFPFLNSALYHKQFFITSKSRQIYTISIYNLFNPSIIFLQIFYIKLRCTSLYMNIVYIALDALFKVLLLAKMYTPQNTLLKILKFLNYSLPNWSLEVPYLYHTKILTSVATL